MKPKPPPTASEVALRSRAEERLKSQRSKIGDHKSEADTQRLLHELQVHQVQLEMQNEELQQAGDKAESEREKYTDLYDLAPVGYLTLDREGAIHESNLTCASLLGIERSRLLTRRFGPLVAAPGLPEFNGFLTKVFDSKVRESCEVLLRPEGKPAVEVRIEAAIAASGEECRAAVIDITERKRAEADRLVLSKLESTGILAGGIAHDFNNLLTVILMNLELGQMLAPAEEKLAHHLEQAKKATLLARGLTQQLITLAVKNTPIRKTTDLASLVRESARLALSGSRVRCNLAFAGDLWPAEVDAGQIAQVIRNIVQNAREAMADGGVITIRGENVVLSGREKTSLPPGEYVRVSIADQGGGVAREALSKIFDPYFSTKQRGEQRGMGLGLTICHSVIQKHGGTISVESEESKGTTFKIDLPASRKGIAPDRAARPAEPLRRGRILLMDDEAGVKNIIGATLRQMGHEVELASDGQTAIEVYRRARDQGCPFDVVMLDLTVRGGMGAEEAMRALLRMDPGVKAIVMSGYANDPVVLHHERHGFKGALAKPFEVRKLQETLARVMESGPKSQTAP